MLTDMHTENRGGFSPTIALDLGVDPFTTGEAYFTPGFALGVGHVITEVKWGGGAQDATPTQDAVPRVKGRKVESTDQYLDARPVWIKNPGKDGGANEGQEEQK